jgi:hypothetical protein
VASLDRPKEPLRRRVDLLGRGTAIRLELADELRQVRCRVQLHGLAGVHRGLLGATATLHPRLLGARLGRCERLLQLPPLGGQAVASALELNQRLTFVGGADPQDPVTNLSGLKRHFPDSGTVVFPRIGHDFNIGGCVDDIMADFADRGTTKGVDTTRCAGAVVVPPFVLSN